MTPPPTYEELEQRVRQLEQELEKRAQTEDVLRTSEDKCRSVMENVRIGVALISRDMEILALNKQMKTWFPLVDETKRPICFQAFNVPPRDTTCTSCPTHETLLDGEPHEAVTEMARDGEVRHYRIVSSPIKDRDGNVTAAIEVVEDYTERVLAEKKLQEYQDRLEELVKRRTQSLLRINEELEKENAVRQRAEKELETYRHHLEELVHERTVELIRANEQLEKEISERKRLTETTILMEERRRLARELHDSVTQSLYSVTLFAATARRLAATGDLDQLGDCLDELGRASRDALKEMRLLVYELRPSILDEEGLVGAIQQRLDAVERRSGVKAQLIIDDTAKLPVGMEEGLYRIIQEALNNTLKHAAATSVTVRINISRTRLSAEVVDNGIGIDQKLLKNNGGMGLISMRERAEKLGGTLAVLSSPGKGTKIALTVDLANARAAEKWTKDAAASN